MLAKYCELCDKFFSKNAQINEHIVRCVEKNVIQRLDQFQSELAIIVLCVEKRFHEEVRLVNI